LKHGYRKGVLLSNFICWLFAFIRLFAFSESENKIDKPSDKRNHSDHPPQSFLSNGSEILANDIDDCKDRQ